MAGDYHFTPEREEEIEKANKAIKEESKKYNSEAFKDDSEKTSKTNALMFLNTFDNMYETLCYNLAMEAGSKLAEPAFKSLIDKARIKLSRYVSQNFVDKFTRQVELLRDDKITTEEFLNNTQKYGEIANKYFVDNNNVDKSINRSLKQKFKDVDKKAGEKWVENASKEVGDSKLKAITKSVEAIQPGVTTNHIKNVGSMLEDYINTPEIAEWLSKEGYDIDKLKQVAKLIGESHDDGKLLVLLDDVESSRYYPKGKNPVKPHEEKGEALAKSLLTPDEDKIPGGIEESYSSIMNKHGDVDNIKEWATKADTPLTQLVAGIDQMEAFVSPRGYKEGSNPNLKTTTYMGNPEKAFGWQVIEDRFDFPNEVRKALGDHYSDYYKHALEQRTGIPVPDGDWDDVVKPIQQQLLHKTPLANYYEYLRQKAIKEQKIAEEVGNAIGAEAIRNTDKKASKHQVRTDVYDKYNEAYSVGAMSSDARKTIGFLLGTIGLDPNAIKAKAIADGDPEVLKQSLIDFNNKFQASDQDSNKKEAIQFVTDNWDDLSDADKAYFKSKIERDNKDFIKTQH